MTGCSQVILGSSNCKDAADASDCCQTSEVVIVVAIFKGKTLVHSRCDPGGIERGEDSRSPRWHGDVESAISRRPRCLPPISAWSVSPLLVSIPQCGSGKEVKGGQFQSLRPIDLKRRRAAMMWMFAGLEERGCGLNASLTNPTSTGKDSRYPIVERRAEDRGHRTCQDGR